MNDLRQESIDYGAEIESNFLKLAQSKGLKIREASPQENMFKHIDYFMTSKSNGVEYSLDVKGMKKITRQDNSRQDEWLFIELRNVLGKDGWLYGHADYIVFELSHAFVFIWREDLVSICERIIDGSKIAKSSRECAYKVYTRYGRKDLVSRIRLSDVPKNKLEFWPK